MVQVDRARNSSCAGNRLPALAPVNPAARKIVREISCNSLVKVQERRPECAIDRRRAVRFGRAFEWRRFWAELRQRQRPARSSSKLRRQPVSPNSRRKTLVASTEAKILTRLLPSKIAPNSLSCWSRRYATHPARREPSCCRRNMRARLVAVSAVSEPDKNADNMSKMTINPPVSHNPISDWLIDGPFLPRLSAPLSRAPWAMRKRANHRDSPCRSKSFCPAPRPARSAFSQISLFCLAHGRDQRVGVKIAIADTRHGDGQRGCIK